MVWTNESPDSVQITSFRNDKNNPESLGHNRVTAMVRDQNGTLWVGTKEGLYRMASESPARFEKFLHDKTAANSLPDDEIYSLLVSKDGNLWIGTWGVGVTKISASELTKPNPTFQTFPYDKETKTGQQSKIVVNLLEDSQENIWLCNGDEEELTYLAKDEKNKPNPRFVSFANDEGNPFSLGSGSVLSITEDTQGILWISAMTGGLNKLDLSQSVFKVYRHHPGNEPSLLENPISQIVEDADGTVWVAGEKGLTQIIPAADAFSQPTYKHYLVGPDSKIGLVAEGISTLLRDSRDRIWLGTINGGLKLREKNGDQVTFKTFQKDPKNPQTLGNNAVLTLLEDSRGTIWVGTYQGLYKMVEPTEPNSEPTFIAYRAKKGDATTLSNDIVEALTEGPDGSIWVGTTSGLNRIDATTNQITQFTSDDNDPESLNDEFINSLFTSSTGILWVGTRKGLCKFEAATGKFSRLSSRTGLDDSLISSIKEDVNGYLWIGTIKGLFQLDTNKNIGRRFSKNSGLPGDIFNRGATSKAKDGTLYFGTAQGVVVFNPAEIKTNTFAPPIVLTEFYLANQAQAIQSESVLPSQLQFLDKLTLNYTDNIFGLEFSALNFKQPEDNRYAYKLEGFSDDWIETDGKNRRAVFTNLNPGEYTFRVKAANNDGVWNEEGAALKVVVLPPWWKTWWAQTLFYSIIIICLLAVPFIRLSMLKKQQRVLEEQVETRTHELSEANHKLEEANHAKSIFLSNMSHELRTPLNAVIGFSQLLGRDSGLSNEQSESLGVIQRSGEHLLGLINDVLSISKIEAGKLVLAEQVFNPKKMLLTVEEMIRVRADAKDISLLFEVPENIPALVKGDESKLRQVLINLLGNAVKFTETGGVVLRCDWNGEGQARFEIEDTGFGISEDDLEHLFQPFRQTESGQRAKEGTGLGLVISQEIVRLMSGEIKVKSRLGKGTVFTFEVNLATASEAEKPEEKRKVVGLAADQPSRRILVVDDTLENRMLLAKLLFAVGFEVQQAANGEEAFDIWSRWQPNLIFMDLRMPVVDGYEATRRIRAADAEMGQGSHNKIVALTASAFESERGTVIKDGADDFLSKPFRQETIFENLTKHLGVIFAYESEEKSDAPSEIKSQIFFANLTLDRFAKIAPDLLAQLERALRLGDDVAALQVNNQLRQTDPGLAAAIEPAVKSFDFDVILQAMEKANPQFKET